MTNSMNRERSEFSQLVSLALPIMAAQLAQMGMGVVDNVMAGRFSAVDLAGVALGGAFMWPAMIMMMGFLQAVTPTIAQMHGSGRQQEIGEVVRQALWMALIASVLIVVLLMNSRVFYEWMGVDAAAIEISVAYLQAAAWGIPGLMGYFVLRYFAEALGFTRPAMFIALFALALKIPLNYIFMYGMFGLPERGGVGCGYATAIVMWLEFVLITVVVLSARFRHIGWQAKFSKPNLARMSRLLRIGLPIGATMFFEMGLFTSVTLMAGRLGADVVASHTIAMNVGGITFMFPLAIGIAASIRIGFNVGADKLDAARTVAKIAMLATVIIGVISIGAVVALRYSIAAIYTNDPGVLELAATLMLFVAVFQLFDNCQATAIGALRGYKDTRVPMLITLLGYWMFGFPLAAALGFGWFSDALGVYGFWLALILALVVVSIFALSRLYWLSKNEAVIRQLSAG